MNSSLRALYLVGFTIAIFGLGFGIFIQYDQFRLFLALGGFVALIATIIGGFFSMVDNDIVKEMPLAELEEKRPDLQIVKKAMLIGEKPETEEDHVIPRRVREFPLECFKCNLLISPSMSEVTVGGRHFHEDCWKRQTTEIPAWKNQV